MKYCRLRHTKGTTQVLVMGLTVDTGIDCGPHGASRSSQPQMNRISHIPIGWGGGVCKSVVDGRGSPLTRVGRFGTVLEKDACNLLKPALQCQTKRSQSILVLGIHIRAMLEKHADGFHLSFL